MTAWFDPRRGGATAVQLELPFPQPLPSPRAVDGFAISDRKRMRGRSAYLSGLAAEEIVARHYAARGQIMLAQRWRGSSAEIDLILGDGDWVIFVEVKKSRSFDSALLSLGTLQRRRIVKAASEFLGGMVRGQLTPMRIDLAMVNELGAVDILENAFGEDD